MADEQVEDGMAVRLKRGQSWAVNQGKILNQGLFDDALEEQLLNDDYGVEAEFDENFEQPEDSSQLVDPSQLPEAKVAQEFEAQKQQLETEKAVLLQKSQEIEELNKNLEGLLTAQREQLAKMKQELEEKALTAEEERRRRDEIDSQRKQVEQSLVALHEAMKRSEQQLAEAKQENERSKQKLLEQEKQVQKLLADIEETRRARDELSSSLSEAKKQIAEKEQNLQKAQSDLTSKEDEIRLARETLERATAEEKAKAEQELQVRLQELDALRVEKEQAEQLLNEKSTEVSTLKQREDDLQRDFKQQQEELQTVKTQYEQDKKAREDAAAALKNTFETDETEGPPEPIRTACTVLGKDGQRYCAVGCVVM